VHPELLRKVEPFPTRELVPYNPGFLSGWVVERYQIDLMDAARHARELMEENLRKLCAARVPGDTHRDLRVAADFSGQTFKHILAPIWMLNYTFGAKSFQVVVNGYTGAIAGESPKSIWKVLLLVLAAIVIISLIVIVGQDA
jgi:hypothetical protein